ncbi:hypothetical protein MMC2321_01007 [Chitinophaga sp. MM2321]
MTVKMTPIACVLVTFYTLACNSPAPEVSAVVSANKQHKPPTDTMIATGDTIQIDRIASWNAFVEYDGKYASDINIFEVAPLKTRFENLLGKARKTFMERLKVTPPIEVENKILFNEGYMPGKSGYDDAAIAIDMDRDIIYVGFTINKKLLLFSEKGDTDYPEKFLQWLTRIEGL